MQAQPMVEVSVGQTIWFESDILEREEGFDEGGQLVKYPKPYTGDIIRIASWQKN